MKLPIIMTALLLTTSTGYSKTEVKASRAPASVEEKEECKILQGYAGYTLYIEGMYVQNCDGHFKYTPANPQAAKTFTEKSEGMLYIEPQTAFGKAPASVRKIESKNNIVKDGHTYSTLKISKDKKGLKNYAFEHLGQYVTSVAMVDAQSGDKYYVDPQFCNDEMPKLNEKIEKMGAECADLFNDIDKQNAQLLERGKGTIEIAENGMSLNAKKQTKLSRFSDFNNLVQMCMTYQFISVPESQKAKGFGIQGGISAGTIGM